MKLIINGQIELKSGEFNPKIELYAKKINIGDVVDNIGSKTVLSGPYKVINKIWDFDNKESTLIVMLKKF